MSFIGKWKDQGGDTITIANGYTVTYPQSTKRPAFGGAVSGSQIEVNFYDYGGPLQKGTRSGDKLTWTNTSFWTRVEAFKGKWADSGGSIITIDETYKVKYSNGRGPFHSVLSSDGKLRVEFDTSSETATLNGESITWTNGSSWTRADGFQGKWKDKDGNIITIGDGYTLNFGNGRGPFGGAQVDGKLRVAFSATGGGTETATINGSSITWTNNTTWTRVDS